MIATLVILFENILFWGLILFIISFVVYHYLFSSTGVCPSCGEKTIITYNPLRKKNICARCGYIFKGGVIKK